MKLFEKLSIMNLSYVRTLWGFSSLFIIFFLSFKRLRKVAKWSSFNTLQAYSQTLKNS